MDDRRNLSLGNIYTLSGRQAHWEHGFSFRAGAYPRGPGMVAHFEKVADTTPDAPALVYGAARFTYHELDERANRLAHLLRSRGLQPGELVGILVERSPDLPIAMLAILKAGGAYVPLDPTNPPQRWATILEEARLGFLLAQSHLVTEIITPPGLVLLDREEEAIAAASSERLGLDIDEGCLAYLLFTSGSTGKPKGVLIPQLAVNRIVLGEPGWPGPGRRIAQLSSAGFDASTLEIWGALLKGGCVVGVTREDLRSIDRFADLIAAEGINELYSTPLYFAQLVQERPQIIAQFGAITLGGDRCEPKLLRRTLELFSGSLVHGYGPTECTSLATALEVLEVTDESTPVPIGFALAGTEVALFDADLQPIEGDEPGELLLGGDGLSLGYFDKPGLTAEKFVPHPRPSKPGQRLYRTGDLVRRLPNGALEFLGRVDAQVKIRGVRIEPGEIETVWLRHPQILEAAVVALPIAGDLRLVGYFVPQSQGPAPSASELREFLKKTLPEAMVPAAFVAMAALPKTIGGKIDRRALPAPDSSAFAGQARRPPATDLEKTLAGVWSSLLGVAEIGLDDDFFQLGGHSLLVGKLTSQLRKMFEIELPMGLVFDHPKLEELAAELTTRLQQGKNAAQDELPPLPPITRVPRDRRVFPLSYPQERVWLIQQLEQGNIAYNFQACLFFKGRLDPEALRRALQEIVNRHEIFHTTYQLVDSEPAMVLEEPFAVELPFTDLRELGPAGAIARAEELFEQETSKGFDLSQRPLIRWNLYRLEEERWVLLQVEHHFVHDGWSLSVLARELQTLYRAFAADEPSPLPSLEVQFPDFTTWQRREISGQRLQQLTEWWRQKLDGMPGVLELPTDRPRPDRPSSKGESKQLIVPRPLYRDLRQFSREHGTTLYMTMLATFATLMHRYSGQSDLAIGSGVANRSQQAQQGMIGMIVNSIVLRCQLEGDPTFGELLGRIRKTTIESYEHQDMPFEHLVGELRPERHVSRNPMFQVMFSFHDAAVPVFDFGPGLEVRGILRSNHSAKIDMNIIVAPQAEQQVGHQQADKADALINWEYNRELFDRATIRRMIRHYLTLLRSAIDHPEQRLSQLEYLGEDELKALEKVAIARSEYPREAALATLFTRQATARPAAIAVVYGERRLSYAELDARSSRLAHLLREKGIRPGQLVGLYLERGPELVVGLLGILKAGGAYVPLDPAHPKERLAGMIEDADLPLLLTENALLENLPAGRIGLAFEDIAPLLADGSQLPAVAPELAIDGDWPACVIFTSGSTGRPKGTLIRQRGISRLVLGTNYLQFGPDDRVGQASNASFDAATFDFWVPLLAGGRIVGIDRETLLSPARFGEAVEREGINVVLLTTAHFHQLVQESPEILPKLRALVFGGERCEPELVKLALAHRPQHLQNLYGPTECTTLATWYEVEMVDGPVPIGFPVGNTETWVLDRNLRPVPVGVPGELCLGGDGLAFGYLGRPALTAEKFVPHPLAQESGARLYRTGDLVLRRQGGELDFLGRIDSQVKLRGFRIELGEIEVALARHPALAGAVVLLREDRPGDRRLVAYVAPRAGEEAPAPAPLRDFLRRSLPDYMVPSAFLVLASLPINATGKIDRKALPAPVDTDADELAGESRNPRSPLEELLAGIWCQVLSRQDLDPKTFDIDANFFEIGGHSLLGMQLIARLRRELGVDLGLASLFEGPTVALQAQLIEIHLGTGQKPATRVRGRAAAAGTLSFAQERLYFLHRLDPEATVYNVPIALRLRGPLDTEALRAALEKIENRHAVLRTFFREENGVPLQVVLSPARLELKKRACPESELAATLTELAAESFDLRAEKPWRVVLLALDVDDHVLFVNVHHIAFDGLSFGIFEKELALLYAAQVAGDEAKLPELNASYADYAAWQRSNLEGENLGKQLEFWREHVITTPLELPADRARPAQPSYRGGFVRHVFDPDLVLQAEKFGRGHGSTPFITFLTTFEILLARLSGQHQVQVGVPVAGRLQTEFEPLLGLFLNNLVLGCDVQNDPAFLDLLNQTRRHLIAAFAHQDLPFEKLVEGLQLERDPSRHPLFQVGFQLIEQEMKARSFAGLEVETLELQTWSAKFDLNLTLLREGQNLVAVAVFARDLYDDRTVSAWLELYEILLQQILAAPQKSISHYVLQRPADRALYTELNANQTHFPSEASLAELFAAQVVKTPHLVALEHRDQKFTYQELDRQTENLARQLRHLGAGPGTMIGLCFERGFELPIAILAVIKTGAAYVPLDGEYPEARLKGMAEDTAMNLLLASPALLQKLPDLGIPTYNFETLTAASKSSASPSSEFAKGRSQEGSGPACHNEADRVRVPPGGLAPAVTIFTSGSTGRPKGVVVTHRAICRLVRDTNYIQFHPGDLVVQASSASFDAYSFEMWGAFLNGGQLLVVDRETLLSPKTFAATLEDREVSALFLTLALFSQMVLEAPGAFGRVRYLLFGGESCDPNIVRRAREINPPVHLQHVYGPTECTTYATFYEVENVPEGAGSVPIGKPLANTEVLVLDRWGRPAAVGVPGELCLGGDGLALGYWKRPATTAAAFVPHPCASVPGQRLYRTGDLARLLPSGDLDFLGRIDFQVKVRGHRIELLEVEVVLGRHPAVREKIVLTQGQGRDQQLVAFVTVKSDSSGEPAVSAAELQRFCAQTLPAFSIPLVRILESMPLNLNGKIDRQALPALVIEKAAASNTLLNPTENQIAAILLEILGLPADTQLGGDDDFFTLGGHSLLAARFVDKVQERCGVEIPIRTLFVTPSVEALAAAVDAAREADPAPTIEVPTEAARLSFSQLRLYFLHRFNPGSPAYNLPTAYRLRGKLDEAALQDALTALEERQEVLRTRFREIQGNPYPEILPAGIQLEKETILESGLTDRLLALAGEPFDLLQDKCWRPRLLELGEEDHVLFVLFHHIAFDGLSLRIFEQELGTLYQQACGQTPQPLPALPMQYTEFAAWQSRWLQGDELEHQLAFWREQILPEPLELPTDHPRPPAQSFHGGCVERRLDHELVTSLQNLGREHGATAFLSFLAPFQMLLARISGQYQVAVGVPFSGRHQGKVENLIGFFINTLVLKADLADDPSLSILLPRLRQNFAQVFTHQDVPFEKLVEELRVPRDTSRNPLYQVSFQLFEAEAAIRDFGPNLAIEGVAVPLEVAKADLEWTLTRLPGGDLRLRSYYATDLFDRNTVAGWLELYEILLRQIVAEPARPLSTLSLLRPADRELYREVNNNHTAFPRESNLIAEWNSNVQQFPDHIAAEYHGFTLTYRELDRRTSRLARHLLGEGIKPGDMVGVCIERSLEMVVAMLAIVKTGSAYVPLDADYPVERLVAMASDTRMPLLLAGAHQQKKLVEVGTRVLEIHSTEAAAKALPDTPLPAATAFPEAAANVIFTSGSTGRPKGVVVTHRGVLRLVRSTNYMDLQPGDVVVQAASPSFDVLTFELWGALMNGGRLLVIDRDTLLQPRAFAATIADRDIAALFLTVALFSQMVQDEPQAFRRVRHLFFGGEACEPSVVRRALEHPPGHLQNGYGPTECTCYANVYEVKDLPGDARSVPIGPPMSNTEALIIDRFGQVASIGVHGELCLGGDGLAWGYWRKAALTARAFVPHPHPATPGQRLYRTGDLARLLPSGDFDYLGRIDFQVKVRGYRIELLEVEAVLGRHPAVREKIVLTQGQGRDQQLVAFVTVQRDSSGEPAVSAAELQRFCAEILPAFSIPLLRILELMPLTPNGKIDRQALPKLSLEKAAGVKALVTPTEEQIASIFLEVLNLPADSTLGGDDDFFALGGHSLLATRLVAKVQERCGVEIPVRTLFAAPTVEALATAVDAARATTPVSISKVQPEAARLSFSQLRLYFLHRFNPASPAYNLPTAYRLRGKLDEAALQEALTALEERQEVLRTRFREADGIPYPEILPAGIQLEKERVPESGLKDRLLALAGETFDLLQDKSWRPRLLELGEDDHVLFTLFHHIAFDGLSVAIFERELGNLYRQACGQTILPLPALAVQYTDFAAWQNQWLQGEELERQLTFWREHLVPEPLELPTDHPRPAVQTFRGGCVVRHLDHELVASLEKLGRQQGATAFLSFLAPFQMLLARLSGQQQVAVGVPFSGRHQGEALNLIGFFINTLMLKADFSDDPSLTTLLPRLRQTFAEVFAHQDLPFEKLVEELRVPRDASRNPLYLVSFQLFESEDSLRDFGPDLEVEGVPAPLEVAKADLEWILTRLPGGDLRVRSYYAADLFDPTTVAGWLELYEILLRQIVADPAKPLSALSLLRPTDRELYRQVNNNHTPFPRESNLIAEWNAHVEANPDHIAAEFQGRTLTYRELDRRTSRLARYLLAEGIQSGDMVGVCIERGLEMVVAMLAIVKTGSAYVPLDADYPVERLVAMVEDTSMPLLLAGPVQQAKLGDVGTRVLEIGAAEVAAKHLPDTSLPATTAFPEAAANVIFTSGSTGRPKGVVVTHRGVLRLVRNTNYMDLQPGDVVVQAASPSFDVLTFELWGALMNGGRLLVIDRDTLLQPRVFAATIADRDIAALFLTVALFGQMVQDEPRAFERVRHLFFGGEACEPSVVRRALEHPPGHLQNGYGPTECTCYANVYEIHELPGDARSVPIGPPMSNTEALILDRFGQVASIGVHGELCLGGDGLAWGYWRKPALTAKAFVPHPHPATPGERLYRTGDLARILPSGDFDYLGRIDFQVKVRGFRIELGEIEAVLGRHPAVREKIALTRGRGAEQVLVAFVVVQKNDQGAPLAEAAELQRYCAQSLPAFAVPLVRLLEVLPLTPNGKIDRNVLPAHIELESLEAERPQDALERLIAEAWAEILEIPLPGRQADFFAQGGHSLAAMRVGSSLTRNLGLELPLPLLFNHPILGEFATAARAHLAENEEGRELLAALAELDAMGEAEMDELAAETT